MTRLRARVAERLKGAQNTYAMLTTFNEIDMTNLMQLRTDFKVLFLHDVFVVRSNDVLGTCKVTENDPVMMIENGTVAYMLPDDDLFQSPRHVCSC